MTSKKREESGSQQSPQSRTPSIPRNPPNEIQRILQFTEHAHRDNEKSQDADQSGEDAVDRVASAVQHGGQGIRPFFSDKLL
jgi:hypothetical protein